MRVRERAEIAGICCRLRRYYSLQLLSNIGWLTAGVAATLLDTKSAAPYTPSLARALLLCKLVEISENALSRNYIGDLNAES